MTEGYFTREKEIISEAKEVFGRFGDVEDVYSKLEKPEKEKFLRICFFYYHRYYKIKNIDEGLILIIIASSIEALVSEVKYKDFRSWYLSECKDRGLPIEELLEQYKKIYGASKKFVYFWENFVSDGDREDFEEGSYYLDPGYNRHKLSIKEASKLLYQLRSDFVHNAEYVPIANDKEPSKNRTFLGSGFTYKKVHYFLGIEMNTLASIFEKGFINYFKQRINPPR